MEDSDGLKEYVERVPQIIRRALNAECCSLFLRDPHKPVLRYAGGVGYKSDYESHEYSLPRANENAGSLTAYIAQKRIAISRTEEVLAQEAAGGVRSPAV